MASDKKTLKESLPEGDERFYSINFLAAELEVLDSMERDERILRHHLPSRHHHNRNFSAARFPKNVSTPLSLFPPVPAPEEPGEPMKISPTLGRYFLCYACCLPVRGPARSILCDLQRGSFLLIPNVLVDILEICRTHTIEEVYDHYGHQHDREIDEYFEHLVAGRYGFYTDEPQRFPAMSLDWRSPNVVTNCLIDFDAESRHDLTDLNEQLANLRCAALEMRFFLPLDIAALSAHLQPWRDSTIRSISLLMGDHPSLTPEALDNLLVEHKRIKHVTIHSCPERDEFIQVDLQTTLRYTKEVIDSEACCGNVSSRYFSCTTGAFTEALRFNNCLNRKVGIDRRGAIKNCPSMPHSFGELGATPLATVIESADFQKPWGVTKDQVPVCQDCEFRYICHDCRAYVQDPRQPLSKPAKCRYNPYEARWE